MPEKMNEACSICGVHYVYTSQHERNVHGIYLSGPKRRRPYRRKKKPSTALVPVNNNKPDVIDVEPEPESEPVPTVFRPIGIYIRIEDEHGNRWIAKREND